MADLLQENNPLGMMQDIMSWLGSLNKSRNEDLNLGVDRPSWGGPDPIAEAQARSRLEGKIPIDPSKPGGVTIDDATAAGMPIGDPLMELPTGGNVLTQRRKRNSLQQQTGVPLSQLGVGAQIKASSRLMRSKLRGTIPLGATFD